MSSLLSPVYGIFKCKRQQRNKWSSQTLQGKLADMSLTIGEKKRVGAQLSSILFKKK